MIAAPPPGGWKVHPRLRTLELRRAWLVGLGGVVIVGGMALFALWRVWIAVDVAWRYGHGVPAVSAELGVALVSALLTALVMAGGLREVRTALARLTLTAELAKNGALSVVELLDTKRDERGFRVMLHYRYRTPGGAVLEGSIASSEGGAYRVAESDTKSLALVSRDGRHGVLLTRSGYPLLNADEALRQR